VELNHWFDEFEVKFLRKLRVVRGGRGGICTSDQVAISPPYPLSIWFFYKSNGLAGVSLAFGPIAGIITPKLNRQSIIGNVRVFF
jgi:hypothetical protein